MPSTGEGFGIVFLEAAASGVPVIAGNKDGSVDALADGALGTLLDPNDTAALSRAIIEALRMSRMHEPDAARHFGRAAFEQYVDDLLRSLTSHVAH
jgi:glycosyltransferase involved in cell wall biosynthesis